MSYLVEKEKINILIQEINHMSGEVLKLKGIRRKKKNTELKTLRNILKIKKNDFIKTYTFNQSLKEEFGDRANKQKLIDWFLIMEEIYVFNKSITVKALIEIAENNDCKVVS